MYHECFNNMPDQQHYAADDNWGEVMGDGHIDEYEVKSHESEMYRSIVIRLVNPLETIHLTGSLVSKIKLPLINGYPFNVCDFLLQCRYIYMKCMSDQ